MKNKTQNNKDLKEVCHRCGAPGTRETMYHSQSGFNAFWYCSDRGRCAKTVRQNDRASGKKTENQNRAWLKIKIANFLYRIDHPNAYGSMKKVETLAKDLEEILKTIKKNI